VLLAFGGVDVDFDMNGVGAHRHAFRHWRHFNAEEVVRDDFKIVLGHGIANIKLVSFGSQAHRGDYRDDARCCQDAPHDLLSPSHLMRLPSQLRHIRVFL